MEDRGLLNDIYRGDRAAFNILTDRYYASLCSFAYRISGDYQAAEDIVQDVLVNIWTKRRSLRDVEYVRNYLYSSVRNHALTYLRADKRRTENLKKVRIEEEDISLIFIEQETNRLLAEAIDKLPPRTAEVIRSTLAGERQEKIGTRMGIALPTVKALKAEGIKKLRGFLKHKLSLLVSLAGFY